MRREPHSYPWYNLEGVKKSNSWEGTRKHYTNPLQTKILSATCFPIIKSRRGRTFTIHGAFRQHCWYKWCCCNTGQNKTALSLFMKKANTTLLTQQYGIVSLVFLIFEKQSFISFSFDLSCGTCYPEVFLYIEPWPWSLPCVLVSFHWWWWVCHVFLPALPLSV